MWLHRGQKCLDSYAADLILAPLVLTLLIIALLVLPLHMLPLHMLSQPPETIAWFIGSRRILLRAHKVALGLDRRAHSRGA